jgi:hypothetical protein
MTLKLILGRQDVSWMELVQDCIIQWQILVLAVFNTLVLLQHQCFLLSARTVQSAQCSNCSSPCGHYLATHCHLSLFPISEAGLPQAQ